MAPSVDVRTVAPRTIAAVRREIPGADVATAWGPALAEVWSIVRGQAGLWTDGHNTFLYHPNPATGLLECEFGVEVTRAFAPAGEVHATETPGGEVAVAVHRGPYDRLHEAHAAIERWMDANRRQPAGYTWEIYGDPTPNPADTRTSVVFLLE